MTNTCTYTFNPDSTKSTLKSTWECPHETVENTDTCMFHMTPEERDKHGITDEDVTETLLSIMKAGAVHERQFIGATLGTHNLEYRDIEGIDQHRIDFRHATIDGFHAERARFEEQLDFRDATIGTLDLNNTELEEGILGKRIHITEHVTLFETVTTGDNTNFENAVFDGNVVIDEADFNNDVTFDGATFNAGASFEAVKFYGRANVTGDNSSFNRVTFSEPVSFQRCIFEYTQFNNVTFNSDVNFEELEVNGAVEFIGTTFNGAVTFNESIFTDDTDFTDAEFKQEASFVGSEFDGGTAVIDDDVSFENAEFNGNVNMKLIETGSANFTGVTITSDSFIAIEAIFNSEVDFTDATLNCDEADFTEATFNDETTFEDVTFNCHFDCERSVFNHDVIFNEATFEKLADFDEVLFNGDAQFIGTRFNENAVFRGAEFYGGTNYHEEDAVFRNAVFNGDADFTDTIFTSGDFRETSFKGNVDFTETEITDELFMKAISFGDDTYINFTDAYIADGGITQPTDGWVRYDLTNATIGDIDIAAEQKSDYRELLDYIRFCNTTFNEFDFSEHTTYLDRNNWVLHEFNAGTAAHRFDEEMTPETVEKTYLKAKQSASDQSQLKAAGEFRVRRQQAARDKFNKIASDETESPGTRLQNLLRSIENKFLGVTCGYGLRLYRITTVFMVFPIFSAFIFTFGGGFFKTGAGQIPLPELLTSGGVETLLINIYFSYITFLTIGYGNIAPQGMGARFLAAILVYMNVILAGLFLYALIKRSEV